MPEPQHASRCTHKTLLTIPDNPGVLGCVDCGSHVTKHTPDRPLSLTEQRLILGSRIQALLHDQVKVPFNSDEFRSLQQQIDLLEQERRNIRPLRFIHKSRRKDGAFTYPCPGCGRQVTMTMEDSNGALTDGMLSTRRCPSCYERYEKEVVASNVQRRLKDMERLAPHASELADGCCRFCRQPLTEHGVLGYEGADHGIHCRRSYRPDTGGEPNEAP